ncbi:GIY-YIG nuclease family protein [Pararhizobium antarcticum]|uniref:Bacteriophage T5 Orf172 DNA-binding domain-containing protein n=1 Tax=Pararhizobium antarcticum TaxID=1798805 RepID=A0A657LX99_9HYPH|nr:GIY-YIG nuclease family protein [Pararhizobium antarcticum]OJF99388.1 hypothetical protein AX760_12945 [Pararhizobium antarcticum]
MADFTDDDDALLAELGVEVAAKRVGSRTPQQERVIAGFEDIQRFVEEHGHAPRHGESHDIFERLYAVRLDRIAKLPECRDLVGSLDHQGLLTGLAAAPSDETDDLDDDALLAELGVDGGLSEIMELRHVRSSAEKRAADEIANRERCADFASFKPLFEQVQRDLDQGIRTARKFERKSEIEPGRFFILGGQKAYVAEKGKVEINASGNSDARLRVVFDNGTESNLLMRSLQKALTSDEAGRRIDEPVAGPLFADQPQDGDAASGTIYVLRSMSDHPMVAAHRDLVHKIGVTSNGLKQRIAGARMQPTFLLADVEVVATYELFNINRSKLENLIHRIFEPARFDVEILDRFGRPVVPREWFMVPLFVVDEAVERIRDRTIVDYRYDPASAKLVKQSH